MLNSRQYIGIDIDNVLSATDEKIRELIGKNLNIHPTQQDINAWSYSTSLNITEYQEKQIINTFHRKYITELDVIKGSKSALLKLSELYFIWLITSRPIFTKHNTEDWLNNNGFCYNELTFTANKLELSPHLNFLIEDNPLTAIQFAEIGKDVFLFDYPWNKGIKNKFITRVNSWVEITQLLLHK